MRGWLDVALYPALAGLLLLVVLLLNQPSPAAPAPRRDNVCYHTELLDGGLRRITYVRCP